MNLKVFVDTEFTDFVHPQLLSVGLVTHDGRERYIEVDLHTRAGAALRKCSSSFVCEHVLSQFRVLKDGITFPHLIGQHLVDWLRDIAGTTDGTLELVYDYGVDAELLERAMRRATSWQTLRPRLKWSIVSTPSEDPHAEAARAASFAASKEFDGLHEHHALADARALRASHLAAHPNGFVGQSGADGETEAAEQTAPAVFDISPEQARRIALEVDRRAPLLLDTADDSGAPTDAPVILLDIDDVLCLSDPYGGFDALRAVRRGRADAMDVWARLFHAPAVEVLRQVHAAMNGHLRYVISSTWREHFNRSELVEVLRQSGLGFVAERLVQRPHWRTICWPLRTRADEVLHWLDQHGTGAPFVVIDDTYSGAALADEVEQPNSRLDGRLVLCEEEVGLQPHHVSAILAALRRPL